MPGPGGGFGGPGGGFGGPGGGFGGPGGGFGRPGGGFGGPGGPGFGWGPGFGGGGPWFGGPGFFGWPFVFIGPDMGPCGLPWFWWPLLLGVLPYIIIVVIGIVVIQTLEQCEQVGGSDENECVGYEAAFAIGLALVMIIGFCCCCMSCKGRNDGTSAERAPMLATEAPPPAVVYAEAVEPPPDVKVASGVEAGTVKYYS